jgi:type IV pilus assembly protein PilA
MDMDLFQKKYSVVGFLDDKVLRIARRKEGEEKSIFDEKVYSLEKLSESNFFSEVQRDFGRRLNLVLAEEGVYTFSADIPGKKTLSRKSIEIALKGFFPEESASTAWDYRIASETEKGISLEVTEVKPHWNDILMRGKAEGMVFESILPESSALAKMFPGETPMLIVHRKSADSFLLLFCVSGIVSVAFFFRKPFSLEEVSSFLAYCRKKSGGAPSLVYGSGFSQDDLRGCPITVENSEEPLDPLLGAGSRTWWKRDADVLDLSVSFQNDPWYFLRKKLMQKRDVPVTQGFTLLEILIAVGIIAILATIIVITLDPAERFRNARESRRLSDIQTVSSAIHQYIVDKRGEFPPGIDERERQLGTNTTGCEIDTAVCHVKGSGDCADLSASLKPYLASIPEDPESGSAALTHYTIEREQGGNRIIVRSCDSTENSVIQ